MRRISVTLVALALALLPAASAWAGEYASLTQISSDPYTNVDSQHQTQVEPDTFSAGSTIVSAFQSGRYYNGGASNNGWATSQDGGQTWANGFLPGATVHSNPPGPYARLSDPAVVYSARDDVWLINSLGLKSFGGNDVVVSRSTDGGLTWGSPILVAGTGYNDKNWIGCDNWPASPFYGNCYVTWDDYGQGNRLYMSTSRDGGLTWTPKKAPRGNPGGIGGQPVVQPNGRVIVPAANAFGTQLIVFGSATGGASWTPSKKITNMTSHSVGGGLRASTFLPSVDTDATGKIYVVWADCRFRANCSANDLVVTTSTNGVAWSRVVRIPIDATNSGVDHFLPGLAVSGGGVAGPVRLALTYYFYPNTQCSLSTCQLHVGFISSSDGGATWSLPQTLAGPMSLSWISDTSSGRMVGDYISTSFVGTDAVAVVSLASAPVGGLLQQSSWAAVMPVAAGQDYPLVVVEDPVLSTESDAPAPTEPIVTP